MNRSSVTIRTAANEIAASDKAFSVWNIHVFISIVPFILFDFTNLARGFCGCPNLNKRRSNSEREYDWYA